MRLPRLPRLTLRQRLLSVLLLGLFVAVVNVVSFRWALEEIIQEAQQLEVLATASRLHQQVDMMHDAERADVFAALLATETPEHTDDEVAAADVREHVAAAERGLDQLGRLPLEVGRQEQVDAAGDRVRAFGESARALVLRAPRDPEGVRADLPAFLAEFGAVEADMDAVTNEVFAQAESNVEAGLKRTCDNALARMLARSGLGFALGGLPFAIIIADLIAALGGVRDVAARLARGDFSARNHLDGPDELGDIARSFDELAESLQEMVTRNERAALRSRFSAELVEALEIADSEPDAIATLERAMRETRAERPMELLLADSSRAHLRAVATHPTAGPAGCDARSPWDCVAVRRATPVHFASGEALNACPRLRGRPGGACSATCIPVSFMGRSIGVLHTSGPEHERPSEEVEARLRALAAQAGGRIGTLRVMERTQLQAGTDPLTGLLNRRTLETRVRDLTQARTPFAVAMADLDHFKKLNDTFGHDAGDRALRHFAAQVKANLRPEDILCRFGGEEFVFVMPGRDAEGAEAAMNRLRERLAVSFNGDTARFTTSVGIADSTHGDDLDAVLRVADGAVYAAKQQGRDRVVTVGATRVMVAS